MYNRHMILVLFLSLSMLMVIEVQAHNTSLDQKCPNENLSDDQLGRDRISFRDKQFKVYPEAENHKNMSNVELGAFHLGDQIKNFEGRNVRTRFWRMGGGGVIRLHLHNERPAFVHILKGSVIERKYGVEDPIILKAGDTTTENKDTYHWWKNRSDTEEVHLVAVDLCKSIRDEEVERKEVGRINLGNEFEGANSEYWMKANTIIIKPYGKTKLRSNYEKPTVTYIISGTVLEHRSDKEHPILRKTGDSSIAINNVSTWWENTSAQDVMLWEVDFTKL